MLVMATGTGKTVVMAKIVRDAFDQGYRPLILVHRDELVSQTVEKLLAACSECQVGVIQAGRHDVDADIVVASVQTLTRRVNLHSKRAVSPDRFNLIVTDECHHSAAPTYLAIYDWFGGRDPDRGTLMLGVTATPKRLDGVALGHVWDDLAYSYTTVEAIEDDYLVRPVGKRVPMAELDGKIKIHHGDYSEADLGAKMIRSGHRIGQAILQYGQRHDGSLRRGITFSPTVACANEWAAAFNELGIRSRVVVGSTPRTERHEAYQMLRDNEIDMLVSVMVLTEGFDLPAVELAVIGRPTKNEALYVQMVGRVLRPSDHTGKQDALVLDVCGAVGAPIALDLDCLGLPEACECECSCAFRYLCVPKCDCPVNDQYEIEHEADCGHGCRKAALPVGEMPEGEGPEVDDSEITVVEVEIFAGPRAYIAKRNVKWLTTKAGTPFLPGNKDQDRPTVFLWPEAEGLWTVGSYMDRERPVKHGDPVSLPIAVEAGLRIWGPKPRQLDGAASASQVDMLAKFGFTEAPDAGAPKCPRPFLDKQTASDLISIEFTSRRIDV